MGHRLYGSAPFVHLREKNLSVPTRNRSGTGIDRSEMNNHAALELHEDGSMKVSGLPFESITSTCMLSGSGKWSGPTGGNDLVTIDLILIDKDAHGSCTPDSYSFLELVGHAKPYGLYWVLGDPDSGTGVWLKKQ